MDYIKKYGLDDPMTYQQKAKLDVAIKPKCGRILLFPANWQYRHSGLPPVSSQKYIVGSYLHYT